MNYTLGCGLVLYWTTNICYILRSMKVGNNKTIDFAISVDFDQILTNPILDIAARFWEEERYQAFKITYRSMRRLDDLVDNRKATGQKLSADESAQYRAMISDWLDSVRRKESHGQFQTDFLNVITQFAIPIKPWERLCEAMIYDLEHDGFESFKSFLDYTEGAAVAPASVFMHLCGLRSAGKKFLPPEYDIQTQARPLARFSYLVHIMRDFQKDQNENLNYFADDLLKKYDISRDHLRLMAKNSAPEQSLRRLFSFYMKEAAKSCLLAREMIDSLGPGLEPRYHLSLEIIYALYSQIYDRIDPENGDFSARELLPSAQDIRVRIERTVEEFETGRK